MKSKTYLKNNVNAFILAGGKGKRLTLKKSLIRVKNVPIIENTLEILSGLFKTITIISNNKDLYSYLNVPVISDIVPGAGPKGGIYTGLSNTDTKWNYFVACDMPFISEPVIIKLANFISDDYDCIVPFIKNYYEPLYAFYNRSCLKKFEKSIKSGNFKIQSDFDTLNVKKVNEKDFSLPINLRKVFTNINTKDDLINLHKSSD